MNPVRIVDVNVVMIAGTTLLIVADLNPVICGKMIPVEAADIAQVRSAGTALLINKITVRITVASLEIIADKTTAIMTDVALMKKVDMMTGTNPMETTNATFMRTSPVPGRE